MCDLMYCIRASPSGFPSPCICGIYYIKYLEMLIVKIVCSVQTKMKYRIPSEVELILWSSCKMKWISKKEWP